MCRVHAEEAATVGADVLDRFQARHRTRHEMLRGTFQGRDDLFAQQRLRHALPYVDQGKHEADRQQHTVDHAGEIHQ